MTVRSAPSKMTYQDLLRLPEDLLRHELIEGEHIVSRQSLVRQVRNRVFEQACAFAQRKHLLAH